MSTINIRADKKLKEDASKVLADLGLDMSSAIKVFLKQVVITNSIPFPLKTENGFTVEEEIEMLSESKKLKNKKKFNSAEELHAHLLNEKE